MELKRISDSFNETLNDTNLQNVTIELAETFSDSFLENGILKDIPIISTILGLAKTTIQIADTLFLKKIFYFISEINHIEPSERKRMIDKIDSSEKFQIKVGEKLLYIIDKCDDHETAKYIARLFASFIEKEIDYQDFLKASKVVENIIIGDLQEFLNIDEENVSQGDLEKFSNTGLLSFYIEEVTIEDGDDWKSGLQYKVKGGTPKFYITYVGDIIRKVLKKKNK